MSKLTLWQNCTKTRAFYERWRETSVTVWRGEFKRNMTWVTISDLAISRTCIYSVDFLRKFKSLKSRTILKMLQRNQKRNKRATLPSAWTSKDAESEDLQNDSRDARTLPQTAKAQEIVLEETHDCRHNIIFGNEGGRKWKKANVRPPRTGNVRFSDLGELDMGFVQVWRGLFVRQISPNVANFIKKRYLSTKFDI